MAAISDKVSTPPQNGDGTNKAFAFDFSIVAPGDIGVYVDGVEQTYPDDYSVVFDDISGTVTFLNAPAAGAQILLVSEPDYRQTSEFANQGAYNLATINTINRRATIRELVNHDLGYRAIKAPRNEPGLTIPTIGARANKLAGFDSAGALLAVAVSPSDIATLAGLSSQIATVANNTTSINTVATNLSGANTVATVAANIASVNATATNIVSINTATTNIAAIIAAPAAATLAAHYANDSTDIQVPGQSDPAVRGAKYWNLQTAATALTVSSALPDADKQFRKAYVPGAVYISPRGIADEVGDDYYGSGRFLGFYVQCTKDTIFNTALWRVWANSFANAIEWKAYIRANNTPFNPSTTGAAGADDFTYQEGVIPAGSFPIANEPFFHTLPKPMFCPAGSYVMFFYRDPTSDFINIARWLGIGSPARHGLLQGPGNFGWNQNWTVGTAGFYQADPRLLLVDGQEQLRRDTTPPDLLIATPTTKYFVAQREGNIYWDTLIPDAPTSYTFDVDASGLPQKGRQEVERWTITPTAAFTGTLVLRVRRRNQKGQQLASKSIAVKVAAANAQAGTMKTVLLIGDSLTADGTIAQTLLDNAAAEPGGMAITCIGTKSQVGNPTPNPLAKSEGVGGVTISYFNNVSTSPFAVGGVIDFPQYLTNNGFAVPDYVSIQLGTNNLRTLAIEDPAFQYYATTSPIPSFITQLNTLITNIRAGGAGIKIVLAMPPMVFDQDAWGDDWSTDHKSARAKRNLILYYQILQAAFGGQEGSGIYLSFGNTAEDMMTSSPRTETLRHSRIFVSGTFANVQSMTQTPGHGALYEVTNVNTAGLVPTKGYFVKVGQSGTGFWRPATEIDGVMRRQTDSLHWPYNGAGGKQIADELWALMKVLG